MTSLNQATERKMQSGQYVKWSAEDFSYVGMIVEFGERVTIATAEGEMSFPVDDGKLTIVKQPAIAVSLSAPKQQATKPVKKPAKSGSKKERAIKLFAELAKFNQDMDQKELRALVIETFQTQLDMTTAGATTYYSMARKGQ